MKKEEKRQRKQELLRGFKRLYAERAPFTRNAYVNMTRYEEATNYLEAPGQEVTKEVYPFLFEDVKIGATASAFKVENTYEAVSQKWIELIKSWMDVAPEIEAQRLKSISEVNNQPEED